jgi:general secretion pathway protein A
LYTSYFGFKENPFSLTPDPDYLYLSRHHKEAFDHLVYGTNERKGFIVITGGIGTGKTTLCRALLETLDASIKTALIFNAYIADMELLRTINQEFGIGADVQGQSKKDHIDRLNQFLLETHGQGGNAVLLIDEAQNLSHAVLEQIRMLSNLETEKEKLIQIVLVGQLELRELLASPALKQLDERIMVRYDLKPLDRKDVQGYVEHRLVVAGGRGNVRFTNGAIEAIYAYSQGNPRRINGVCDRALLIAYSKDEFTVSKKTVQKATEDIRGDITSDHAYATVWPRKKLAPASVLLLFVLVLLAGFAGWNLRRGISTPVADETTPTSGQPGALTEAMNAKGRGRHLSSATGIMGSASEGVASMPEQAATEGTGLFLTQEHSLAGLFRLFDIREGEDALGTQNVHLGLYLFQGDPEHHIMFKKPFWVRVGDPKRHAGFSQSGILPSPRYLLIREVTADGAIAVDVHGKEHPITRDFIMTHWGGEACWVYPYEDYEVNLAKGMHGQDVIRLQYALNELGYSLQPTGIYDNPTVAQVARFQSDFGLVDDGIVGTRTKGLLFQMTNELHS